MYDQAGIFSPETIVSAESTIDAIEARTGAEVVVYTQDSGEYGLTTEETEAKARALIDQWGIGREGFDDGMVIFFDMDPSLEHGQVQLYAAPASRRPICRTPSARRSTRTTCSRSSGRPSSTKR